ncbi:MAG TPA: hypothetical protein VGB19_02760 [Actinomycetota bacterium]
MRGRILMLFGAAALVVGGCTSGPGADVTGTSTTEPEGVVEPSALAGTQFAGTPLPEGDLTPGTYTMDKTTVPLENSGGFDSVRITFTVPRGYESWDLGVLTTTRPKDLGVSFWKVSDVPADPCHWRRGGPPVGPTVDDLATALANQSRRHATTPTDVKLDGYAGKHLTLTVPANIDFNHGLDEFMDCDQGAFYSWDPDGAFGRYHQGPNQVDELWILDIHGFRLVIDAAYYRNTATRYVSEIRGIVGSVRIERNASSS